MSMRAGFGLIELIVALLLISIGVLGLAGTAIVAQRSFNEAALRERSARAAAAVLDSLLHDAAPADGVRIAPGLSLAWSVSQGDGLTHVQLTVTHAGGAQQEWHASRSR